MALHCRMKIYLAAHGHPEEPHSAKTKRTFLRGHMFEKALFDGFDEENPALWNELDTIQDYSRGIVLNPKEWTVSHRQGEMTYAGFQGHSDALLTHKVDGTVLLPDSKAVGCLSYKMTLTKDLLENPFSRGYVGQLHAYRRGYIDQGQKIDGMLLIYYNVCSSEIMFRVVDYEPELDVEIAERLSWAKSPAEPTPDYEWSTGSPIPLACGYCSFRQSCAAVRGVTLEQSFSKGKPVWAPARRVA